MEDCNREIFEKGHSAAMLDACMFRAEEWVRAVAKESGQRVDWHYTGGIANVLYLGNWEKVAAAIVKLQRELEKETPKLVDHRCRCSGDTHSAGRIMGTFAEGAHGPYRAGDLLPEGVVAVDHHAAGVLEAVRRFK